MTSGEGVKTEAVERAWQEVERRWADDAAHRHFIAFCASEGVLSEAAKRYRALSEGDPARRDEAQRRLRAVLGAAMASLDLGRKQTPEPRSRWFFIGCGVGLTLLGYVVLAVLRRFAL